MTTEEKLKEFILTRYNSILEFTDLVGMPYGTIQSIFKRGISNSSVTNIIKICKALDISADELANGNITPNIPLKPSNTAELSATMARMKSTSQEYALDGKTLTEGEKRLMLDMFELSIELLRRQRRRAS